MSEFILVCAFGICTGVALKVMGLIRKYYPIYGRMALAMFYLVAAAFFLHLHLTLAGGLLITASLLMLADLKLHELRVKETNRVIKRFKEEQERLSKKLEEDSKSD